MLEQARKKRVTDIFKLQGNVYAFDSTTIPLHYCPDFNGTLMLFYG